MNNQRTESEKEVLISEQQWMKQVFLKMTIPFHDLLIYIETTEMQCTSKAILFDKPNSKDSSENHIL